MTELAVLGRLTTRTLPVDAVAALREAGWTPCGAGDWAIALRCPGGCHAARISPFDPAAPYTAQLYREAASTGGVPRLDGAIDLDGGGHVMVMEFLRPVTERVATRFYADLRSGTMELVGLRAVLTSVHERARRELPWCGPLDDNPSNVMMRDDGGLVLTDPFFVDGNAIYPLLLTDPMTVARAFPRQTRRYLLDLPLTWSGPWDEGRRHRMRQNLARADAELAARQPGYGDEHGV